MKGITLQEMSDETVQQLQGNYIRQPAFSAEVDGTDREYWVTLDPAPISIPTGFGITIVPSMTNADNPVLVINGLDAIPLKDQKGAAYTAGKLLVGKPYTFRKVGADFLADSGSGATGDATAGDVLLGKTFSNERGNNLTGTMVNRGATNIQGGFTNVSIPAGFYNGAGVVLSPKAIAGELVTLHDKVSVNIPHVSVYTKRKAMKFSMGGTYRISFTLQGGNGDWVYARVYKNGSPVGVERVNPHLDKAAVTYTEDFTVVAGDSLEIWGHIGTGQYSGGIWDFKATSNVAAIAESTLV